MENIKYSDENDICNISFITVLFGLKIHHYFMRLNEVLPSILPSQVDMRLPKSSLNKIENFSFQCVPINSHQPPSEKRNQNRSKRDMNDRN